MNSVAEYVARDQLTQTTLGALSEYITSGSRDWSKYYADSGPMFIRTQDINQNRLSLDQVAHVQLPARVEGKRSLVRKGDLLITITGANVGKVAVVEQGLPEAYVSQSVCLVRLKDPSLAKFLQLQLIAKRGDKSALEAMAYGLGRPVLNLENVRSAAVETGPPNLRNRIVAEIEKQLSRLDEGVANLERVKTNLKRYKAAILQSVTRGSLTTESGQEGHEAEWRWLEIAEIASPEPRSIQSGPFGSNLLHSEFQTTGRLVIGIDNVRDGEFSIGSNHRISDEKFRELEKYAARPRDVLITVMATVGRVCVLPAEIEPAIITKHVYRITVDQQLVVPEYVGVALRGSREVRQQLLSSVQGQTRPGLNGGLIKRIRVPVPSPAQQLRIVAEVDRRLSIVAEGEREVDANLARARALRNAVLAKSFVCN